VKETFSIIAVSLALLSAGCVSGTGLRFISPRPLKAPEKTTGLRPNTAYFKHPREYLRIARVHASKTFAGYSRAKFPYDQEPQILARKLGPDIEDYRVTVSFSGPSHDGHYLVKDSRRTSIETVITSAGRVVSATLCEHGGEAEDMFKFPGKDVNSAFCCGATFFKANVKLWPKIERRKE